VVNDDKRKADGADNYDASTVGDDENSRLQATSTAIYISKNDFFCFEE